MMSIRKVMYSRSRRYKNANKSQVVLGRLFVVGQSREPLCARSRTLRNDVMSEKEVVSASRYRGRIMRLTLAGNSRFRPSLPPSRREPKYEVVLHRGRLGRWVACPDLRPPLQIHSHNCRQGRPLYVRASKSQSFRSKCTTPYRGVRE